MSCPDLDEFWAKNKKRIGKALSQGMEATVGVFQRGANSFDINQTVEGRYIHWYTAEGEHIITYAVIEDPRDLNAILDVYVQSKQRQFTFTAIFVHQWSDGEGNWDVFIITPRSAMHHIDRINGSKKVKDREPKLREDLYTLFSCDGEFPEPGQETWAELLAGSVEKFTVQLNQLAKKYECTQAVNDQAIQWFNEENKLEVQFFVLPDPDNIEAYIRIYQYIQEMHCPVSFLFVKSEEPRLYNIFRLSSRSYLEHHNQLKCPLKLNKGGKSKLLKDLRWAPRWASHVGCIKGCLNYLNIDISDAWLFGGTGHAFVLNISPGLCPSGPTDWNTNDFLRLGCNLGYKIESVDRYCSKKRALREAQERAWDHIQRSIDEGLPCYGWELDIPEYYVIYGYDKTGYYISGPECDEGAGPIPWQNLGTSKIGVVLVSSIRRTDPVDDRTTVWKALSYAVAIGWNKIKWTDRTGGLDGYTVWIEAMNKGKADRFGLGYNAAVWAESRRFAVEFLKEAQQRLDADPGHLFEKAISHYEKVAQNLKTISKTYPFTEHTVGQIEVDSDAHEMIEILKDTQSAETAGLDLLAQLVDNSAPE